LKLAAIDIGSNAARLQISAVLNDEGKTALKKIEYVRFPLRLGQDVFTIHKIGPQREEMLTKLMHAYKILIDLHQVDEYYACATSAMRESKNGKEIAAKIQSELGLTIHIIDGKTEAELINRAIVTSLDQNGYIHIDVGGGSTELNLYLNRKKVASRSFKIGSVRQLEHSEYPDQWIKMEEWIKNHLPLTNTPLTAIGTGGNISKIYELTPRKTGQRITLQDIASIHDHIAQYSLEERINKLRLNPDRADVIIPASEIYLSAMQWAGAQEMLVPEVGLKDGIIQLLYDRLQAKGFS
jgi:exopolyphosphatase/guanosine-5'-triphosphate,3'-diphosphate pyrophosphatase